MTKRYIFSIANNGHDREDWVNFSNRSKIMAAEKWGAEYILHTDVLGLVKAHLKSKSGYFEKFEMLRMCDGDVFFTDTDVVISANCPNPFETLANDCLHASWESEVLVKSRYYEELWPQTLALYLSLNNNFWPTVDGTDCPVFFNSGVLYIPDNVRRVILANVDSIQNFIDRQRDNGFLQFADQEIFNVFANKFSEQGLFGLSCLGSEWNVQVSLEWKALRGKYFWERFRKFRYWRNQAYWCSDARLSEEAYCIHYTGKSRGLLIPEWQAVHEPRWEMK
ncbi:MAG: hypothetical protein CL547_00860 [Alcanivorax sp.]|nr:hypothetical protein [Alcanivorax sp.]|tara:strand:+ start:6039 stop:6875 length:837 start_codon:yes stop_codon:yes gene_type:complete